MSILILTSVIGAGGAFAQFESGSSTLPQPRAIESKAEQRPHVGIFGGAIDPEGSTDSQGIYGVEIGYQPYFPLSLAAEISRVDTTALEQTLALVKATYNFGGTTPIIRHSYAGAILGADFERSGTYVASGPIIGFDIPTRNRPNDFISIGANARYTILSKGDPDTSLGINGVVKYWY